MLNESLLLLLLLLFTDTQLFPQLKININNLYLAKTYMNMNLAYELVHMRTSARSLKKKKKRDSSYEHTVITVNQNVHINGVFAVNFYACVHIECCFCTIVNTHCVRESQKCVAWYDFSVLHYKLMSVMMNDASLVFFSLSKWYNIIHSIWCHFSYALNNPVPTHSHPYA